MSGLMLCKSFPRGHILPDVEALQLPKHLPKHIPQRFSI